MQTQTVTPSRVHRLGVARGRAEPRPAERVRREAVLWLSGLSLLGLGRPLGAAPGDERRATAAVEAWLGLVDGGLEDRSWDEAGPLLRLSADRDDWRAAVRAVRRPLGSCLARRLVSRALVEAPRAAPKGPYAVFRFETTFERKAAAVETVTSARGPDSRWRVAAYYIA